MPHGENLPPESEQMAELLGLPRPSSYDDLKLVDCVHRGFPARSVEHVARAIDPSGALRNLIPRSTVHRRRKHARPLTTRASETLWQVARVFLEARRQYGDAAEAYAFLSRPHPLLDGRHPLDVARETNAGMELVLKLLARAEAGVAV